MFRYERNDLGANPSGATIFNPLLAKRQTHPPQERTPKKREGSNPSRRTKFRWGSNNEVPLCSREVSVPTRFSGRQEQ